MFGGLVCGKAAACEGARNHVVSGSVESDAREGCVPSRVSDSNVKHCLHGGNGICLSGTSRRCLLVRYDDGEDVQNHVDSGSVESDAREGLVPSRATRLKCEVALHLVGRCLCAGNAFEWREQTDVPSVFDEQL